MNFVVLHTPAHFSLQAHLLCDMHKVHLKYSNKAVTLVQNCWMDCNIDLGENPFSHERIISMTDCSNTVFLKHAL